MPEAAATMETAERDGTAVLALVGRLDSEGVARLWNRATRVARTLAGRGKLVVDLGRVTGCDMAGAAFLLTLEAEQRGDVVLQNESPQVKALLDRARKAEGAPPKPVLPPPLSLRALARAGLQAAAQGVAFLGETVVSLIRLPQRRRMLRIADLLLYADQAGVRSMPLILLLGFLIGLILAFQSAVPMKRFGADLYVANLVSISLLRELGPLLAAVILAGRTGSAFAAEIGTMKVNEEIDALVTMGVNPMTMLAPPRLIAVVLVMPVMTLVLDIAGLAGMTVVMMGFGYPMVTIFNQISIAAKLSDLVEGLVKPACFGAVIAAIGCRKGLGTGVGPRAVGLSATGAVVGGIVATIAARWTFAIFSIAEPVSEAAGPIIRVEGVAQRFGSRPIFRDVSSRSPRGEFSSFSAGRAAANRR